jgi:hypothetical protein
VTPGTYRVVNAAARRCGCRDRTHRAELRLRRGSGAGDRGPAAGSAAIIPAHPAPRETPQASRGDPADRHDIRG